MYREPETHDLTNPRVLWSKLAEWKGAILYRRVPTNPASYRKGAL